jgi:2Fe-2S ferredoxin
MPTITYIQPDGAGRTIEVAVGTTVMHASIANDIDGIIGECGGSAMCATCHVYVDEAFAEKLPAMNSVESEMLESTASERRPNSRLGCQIVIGPELDGLRVTLPESEI